MTDQLASAPQAPGPQTPGPRGGAGRPIAIAIAVVGGVVGAATLAQGAAAAWPTPPSQEAVLELSAADVADATALDLDASGADLVVAFADVDGATLTVDAPDADRWRLEVVGGTIRAADASGWWSWGWSAGPRDEDRSATLVLPESLEGALDGEVSVGEGTIDVSGAWRDLALDVASGRASVEATATSATIDVASGSADVDLVVDGDVRIDLASGEILATLEHTGDLEIDVATGSVDGRLVGGPYVVSSDAALGTVDVEVEQRSGASQAIVVDLATGSVRLTDR